MSDLHKITCNGPAFTQGSLPTPKALVKLVRLKHQTIALLSDLAGTNVTGTCVRVKRHGPTVFSTVWAFGHVASWQTRCARAKTLSILIVDITEKKRMKKRLSIVF
jgi:hypothetical protein